MLMHVYVELCLLIYTLTEHYMYYSNYVCVFINSYTTVNITTMVMRIIMITLYSCAAVIFKEGF